MKQKKSYTKCFFKEKQKKIREVTKIDFELVLKPQTKKYFNCYGFSFTFSYYSKFYAD